MKHDRFKAKLAALDALRPESDAEAALPVLRRAFAERSGYVVAKAATIASQTYLSDLLPDVLAAFDRFCTPGSDDPGCRARNALANALKAFEYRDPAPFLAGLTHVALEPVWGESVDTAGPVRATCAQALVACDIDPIALLEVLTDRLVDGDKWVRIDVARAIAQLDRPESGLLLRLKALGGDRDPEVVGQCLLSLLELAPVASIAFVARFLEAEDDDVRFEAVGALAQAKAPEAVAAIERFWSGTVTFELRRATVAALAGSPHPEAADFLLELLRSAPDEFGAAAIAALGSSRFRNETRERVLMDVASSGSEALRAAYDEHFS